MSDFINQVFRRDPNSDEFPQGMFNPSNDLPERIYSVVIDEWPEFPHNPRISWAEYYQNEIAGPRGRGWQDPTPRFFWPKLRRIFLSRTAAREHLLRYTMWGAVGHIVECAPQWETIADANARRAKERTTP